jgi:ABC-type uncharacterized transport system ATPase subunit
MPDHSTPLVRLENIDKRYGKVFANRDISLDFRAGRITALLGENGAGKSTLMSILAGKVRPDRGRIVMRGKPISFSSPQQAIEAGIGMVYQHFKLVENMTVAENVFLGDGSSVILRPGKMNARVEQLAQDYGLDIPPTAKIAALSMGEKQRVEILKLLHHQNDILIFDEPTAVLTPGEIDQLFVALKNMARQNKSIVFISHKLDEVMTVADDIAILRHGVVVDRTPTHLVSSKSELARRMVGKEVLLEVQKTPVDTKLFVLRVEGLSDFGLRDIHLELRQGEVLGIVGVAGNGQKPLVETICGLRTPETGQMKILGENRASFFSRRHNTGSLSYIPEDRQGLATCLEMDLAANFLLTTRDSFSKGPWIFLEKARKQLADLLGIFDIRPRETKIRARQLSGGNLQKLVLAREFSRRPRLIVAEQPTQGLDIAATEEVWNLLLKARERAGILLITGDITEALMLSDRIAVLFRGKIMDTFSANDRDKVKAIGEMMAGIQPS